MRCRAVRKWVGHFPLPCDCPGLSLLLVLRSFSCCGPDDFHAPHFCLQADWWCSCISPQVFIPWCTSCFSLNTPGFVPWLPNASFFLGGSSGQRDRTASASCPISLALSVPTLLPSPASLMARRPACCSRWARNQFSLQGGKPLWIDPHDPSVHHIFIDDNIRLDDTDTIVCPQVGGSAHPYSGQRRFGPFMRAQSGTEAPPWCCCPPRSWKWLSTEQQASAARAAARLLRGVSHPHSLLEPCSRSLSWHRV